MLRPEIVLVAAMSWKGTKVSDQQMNQRNIRWQLKSIQRNLPREQ